jgi:hypothetical protein
MSATVGTIAGTTGLGSARQAVWAPVSQLWWAFQFTGTTTLASWYSSDDGANWNAGATFTMPAVHSSEGRDLMVTCEPINNIDTIWFTFVTTPTTVYAQYALRATISGTTITYHSAATKISQSNISTALTVPRYSSGGIAIGTDNKIHVVNGALDPNQDITWIGTTTADPGTAEQATGPTWGLQTVVDNGQTNVVKSGMTFAMPSGDLFHIGDDGSADATFTSLESYKLPSGGSWSSVGSATGTISAIGKNNWGAVKRTDSDIHLVYRSSTGTLTHRRYDGISWSAGQTIPSQNNGDGAGVAMCSDGVSVWLAIIDTDGANTVRYIQWASNDYTGHGDAWKTWQVLEGSSATRTFLGLAQDTDGNFRLLAYWTEGSSMVAATAEALFPDDPPGLAARDVVTSISSSLNSTTLDIVFTGTQPTASRRQKIVAGFCANYSAARTVSSVVDLCTSPNTYTLPTNASSVGSAQGAWIYFLDLPEAATWSGNYTIRVTFSGTVVAADGGAIAYFNMASGTATATNNNTGTSSTATPGSCTPPEAPATYFVALTDATGANPATFTWPAPYLKEITQSDGTNHQAFSIGDALNSSGARNPSITIDNSLFNAAHAVWPGAPAIGNTYIEAFPTITGLRL